MAASSLHQAVFQIVQRLEISWRVDRAAKIVTVGVVDDVKDFYRLLAKYICSVYNKSEEKKV